MISDFGVKYNVHAEDGCTASHVQHHLVLEDVLVVVDGVAVRARAHLVFQHLLVDAVVVVAVEVVHFAVRHAGEAVVGLDVGVPGGLFGRHGEVKVLGEVWGVVKVLLYSSS